MSRWKGTPKPDSGISKASCCRRTGCGGGGHCYSDSCGRAREWGQQGRNSYDNGERLPQAVRKIKRITRGCQIKRTARGCPSEQETILLR
ncbi:MAG: hypothetical protein FWG87_14040 [Defluviitaleaceae bacterium]|nr:hypothetical protein [Defluviitaleaceae bacterium]